VYDRLRLHFVGTSNQTTATDVMRVMPTACALGVDAVVDEHPTRVPYSEVVRIQRSASGLLAMGSTEVHYTPSKIYPLLLARRPLLAVYHEQSPVTDALRRVGRPPSVRLVTYSDTARAASRVEAIAEALADLARQPEWCERDVDASALAEFFAENLAGRLADVLDRVVAGKAA
jgi:hypothetical protein